MKLLVVEDDLKVSAAMRERRRSARFRITATATVAVVLVLGVTGWILVVAQQRVLTSNLDESLEQVAIGLSSAAPAALLPGFGDDDSFAQVVEPDGTVIAATANLAGQAAVVLPPPDVTRAQLRTLHDLPHDGARFRVRTQRVAGWGPGAVVHVGGTLDDIDESTRTLARSLAVAVPFAAILLAGLVWWLVGRTLRPVPTSSSAFL